ncbi:MAG: hypothetical protein KBS70_09230, partial [Bacteroidales bacterium]|nr:hypothetical protein [Candidatus Colicola equi]
YSNDEDEGEVAVAQFSPDPGYDQIIGVTYKDGVYSFIEESFESASVERLNGKQDTLISGENIKTINGESILGNGNIEISGGDNVFLARYGITTWAEINEAASNGKLIHATFNGRLYNLETALPVESGAIIFYTVQAAYSMRLSVIQQILGLTLPTHCSKHRIVSQRLTQHQQPTIQIARRLLTMWQSR